MSRVPFLVSGTALLQQHEYLVYIQGVDVTPWVSGYSVQYDTDMGGAELTLRNPMDVLVLTSANVSDNSWRIGGGDSVYSEKAKHDIYQTKLAMNQQVRNSRQAENSENAGFERWPLYPPTPIFHKMDPVRIYAALPWLSSTQERRWVPVFCGYVASTSLTRSYAAGAAESTISITCNTLKAVLQKTRIAQNPLFNSDQTARLLSAERVINENELVSLFRDTVLQQPTSVLLQRPPNEIISYLITGRYSEEHGDSAVQSAGVGDIGRGANRFFMPAEEEIYINGKYHLQHWHDGCVYGADDEGRNRSEPLTREEVHAQGINSFTDGPFCPHGRNVIVRFLQPPQGFGYEALAAFEFSNSGQADFISRLDLIDSVLAPINYQFWIAGSGDLVFELPMHDFDLEDFGSYAPLYRIEAFASDTYSENDVDLPTLLTVTGGAPASGISDAGATAGNPFRIDMLFTSLASRFGLVHESISFPYTMNSDSLAMYGVTYMQQKLMDLESYSFSDIGYPLGMTPNRPVYVPARNVMASTASISFSMDSAGSGSFDADLGVIRKRDADGNFRSLFGSVRLPGSYHRFFAGGMGEGVGISVGGVQIARSDPMPVDGDLSAAAAAATGVTQRDIDALNRVQLSPEQIATLDRVSRGDPNKRAFLENVLRVENRGQSAPRDDATSPVGAAGSFQFMAPTARAVGLRVDGQVDERRDFNKSAEAAARLYDDMHRRYGGNHAAMYADYNGGPNQGRPVKDGKQPPAAETRHYIAMAEYLEIMQAGSAMQLASPSDSAPRPEQFAGPTGEYADENQTALAMTYTTYIEGLGRENLHVEPEAGSPNPQMTENESRGATANTSPQVNGQLGVS